MFGKMIGGVATVVVAIIAPTIIEDAEAQLQLQWSMITGTISPTAQAIIGSVMNVPHEADDNKEFERWLVNYTASRIANMTDVDVTIYEDGNVAISKFTPNLNLENAMVESPFSIKNGYKFENGTVYAPNGTAIFP